MSSSNMFSDPAPESVVEQVVEDPVVTTAQCFNTTCGADAVLDSSGAGDPVFRCSCGATFVKWYAEEQKIAIVDKKTSTLQGKRAKNVVAPTAKAPSPSQA